jgi:hypothetical protein
MGRDIQARLAQRSSKMSSCTSTEVWGEELWYTQLHWA